MDNNVITGVSRFGRRRKISSKLKDVVYYEDSKTKKDRKGRAVVKNLPIKINSKTKIMDEQPTNLLPKVFNVSIRSRWRDQQVVILIKKTSSGAQVDSETDSSSSIGEDTGNTRDTMWKPKLTKRRINNRNCATKKVLKVF